MSLAPMDLLQDAVVTLVACAAMAVLFRRVLGFARPSAGSNSVAHRLPLQPTVQPRDLAALNTPKPGPIAKDRMSDPFKSLLRPNVVCTAV